MKILNKKKIILSTILVFLLLFVTFQNNVNHSMNKNDTLKINISETPQIPWKLADNTSFVLQSFSSSVHGSLAYFNETGMWETSDDDTLLKNFYCDAKVCFAELKKGIKFHNGREVTAYDVEFSLIRQLFEKKKSNFIFDILAYVKGVKSFNLKEVPFKNIDGISYPTGIVSGICVQGRYHVVFLLETANLFFFQKISTGFAPIVPIEELKENYIDWKKYPVGFGKYKVVCFNTDTFETTLEKVNPDEKIPRIVKLVFGKDDPGDIKFHLGLNTKPKNHDRILVFPDFYVNGGFLFNFKTELGSNINFRQAISLALDRKKITQTLENEVLEPEDQMLPNYGWLKRYRSDMPMQQQNVMKAKALLNTIPKHLWKNKVFEVHTFWSSKRNVSELPYMEEIVKQLGEIGLKIIFHRTDFNYPKFKNDDKNVLWWTGFDYRTTDPISNFSYFQEHSFFNNISPNDPKFNKMLSKASEIFYKNPYYVTELNEYFTKNHIMVIVFNVRRSFSYNGNKVRSFGRQFGTVRLSPWEIKLQN